MNIRIYNLQLNEQRILDNAKGKNKEFRPTMFKPVIPLAESKLNPTNVMEPKTTIEVKNSGCRCIVM